MKLKESIHNITYVQQSEGLLLSRVGNTNYFKENPYDPWEKSKLRDSIVSIDPNIIVYTEKPSEEKMNKMGRYEHPTYRQYDTHWPIAIQYRGKIILLDGHHRVELAKRSNIKSIDIAVKNVDNIYESYQFVRPKLNEIKKGVSNTGLSNIGVGKASMLYAYNYVQKNFPEKLKYAVPMSQKFADIKFKFLSRMTAKFGINMEDYLWVNQGPFASSNNFDGWASGIDWDKVYSINPSEWDIHDNRVIKYNFKLNMGWLKITEGLFAKNKVFGYFIKYK